VIDADGSYLGKAGKTHIAGRGFLEKFFFKPADQYSVYKPYCKLGAISATTAFPEAGAHWH